MIKTSKPSGKWGPVLLLRQIWDTDSLPVPVHQAKSSNTMPATPAPLKKKTHKQKEKKKKGVKKANIPHPHPQGPQHYFIPIPSSHKSSSQRSDIPSPVYWYILGSPSLSPIYTDISHWTQINTPFKFQRTTKRPKLLQSDWLFFL